MDGDGTYDPIYIDKMLKAAKYHDEIIGARLNGRENIPLLHRFGNKAITFVFNILFGTKLKDVCSGMYLLKTDVAKEVNYESKGFNIEVELAAHVASTTRKIVEIPINYRPRIGKPKLRTWHGVSIVMEAIKLAWRYNPAFFIFMLGATILIPSLTIAAWVTWEWLINGIKHHIWGIIAITGTGVGIISTLLAIMALFIKRIEYRITEKLKQVTNKQNA
jgi:dolichol-phosphate mannosyltransferase